MVSQLRTIAIALLLTLSLSSCGADIQRTEQVPIQPDYVGSVCLVLGQWKGGLTFTVRMATAQYSVRGKSNYLRFHALDFAVDATQGPAITLTANGFISLGGIDPEVRYQPCSQVAGEATDWQIYQVGDFTRGRLRLIRIIATLVLLASMGAIAQQLKTRNLLAKAKSMTVATLAQSFSVAAADYVKVNGMVYHPEPLHAPQRNTRCVYYQHQVTRTHKPAGQKRSVTETLESAAQRIPFWLQDDGYQVQVLPDAAEFVNLVCQRKQQQRNSDDGVKTETRLLPIGHPALVVGRVADQAGQAALMQPDPNSEAQAFIIYGCSEATLKRQIRLGIAAAVVFGLGAIAFMLPVIVSELPDPAIVVERWVRHWPLPF